jgi:hypothetical protein
VSGCKSRRSLIETEIKLSNLHSHYNYPKEDSKNEVLPLTLL